MKFLITELKSGSVSDGSNCWLSPEMIPSETVVVDNVPAGAIYAPFVFYDSPHYGILQIHNFDIDKFRNEQAFVESFTIPEFTPDTFVNRINRSVFTHEKWLKSLPKLEYFWWDTDKRKWVRHYNKIFIIPAWEI